MKVYRIKNWTTHYENNRTKELKEMHWVPIPNSHDGEGYCQMVEGERGGAVLGAWLACVQVASRCDPRGTLLRKSRTPHTAASLAARTRLPLADFEEMLKRSVLSSVGWIEVIEIEGDIEIPHEGAGIPHDAASLAGARAGARRMKEGRKERKEWKEENTIPLTERARDLIWDVVAEVWFGGTVGDPAKKRVGKIVRDLKSYAATPEEIRIRFERYQRHWPTVDCTPEALVKHWAFFEKEQSNGQSTGNARTNTQSADARRTAERAREYHDPATDVA